jgi:hypothetical protein
MNNKEKLRAQIAQGGSNTAHKSFYTPPYETNPYFGASSFYGDQCRVWEWKGDFSKTEFNWFIHSRYKAIGRQLML